MAAFPVLRRLREILCTGVVLALASAGVAWAHCDSMEGPVIADAERALATGDVDAVLKWVREQDEAEIRRAFEMTSAVREESDVARQVADQYFYETLVRIHRASEGEGFTGLKPAGSTDPAIAAADEALTSGNAEPLADELSAAVRDAILEGFATARALRQVAEDSVLQGREYVHAYVAFTHFVESVDHLIKNGASHQHREENHAADH